jgi:hypothetical protein
MAISLEDKLKTLPIERQEYIKKATDELIREEYALREIEKKQSIQIVTAVAYIINSVPVLMKIMLKTI